MKPTSYKNTARYGQDMQNYENQAASANMAVPQAGAAQVEAMHYRAGMEQALKLGHLGLQKDMFDKSLAEGKRQFDIGMGMQKEQFGSQMRFAWDQMKYQRRQNNRAEILGMANVGISIAFGFQQFKQQQKQIEMIKMIQGLTGRA